MNNTDQGQCFGQQLTPAPQPQPYRDTTLETPHASVRVIITDKAPPASALSPGYRDDCHKTLDRVSGIAGNSGNGLYSRIKRVVRALQAYIQQDHDIRAAFAPVSEGENALDGVKDVVKKYLGLQQNFDEVGKRLANGDEQVSRVIGVDIRTQGTIAERVTSLYRTLIQTMQDAKGGEGAVAFQRRSELIRSLQDQVVRQQREWSLAIYALNKGNEVTLAQTGRGVDFPPKDTGMGERIAQVFNAVIEARKQNAAVGYAEREDYRTRIAALEARLQEVTEERDGVQRLNRNQFEQLTEIVATLDKSGVVTSNIMSTPDRVRMVVQSFSALRRDTESIKVYADSVDAAHALLNAEGLALKHGDVPRRIKKVIADIRTALSGVKSDVFKQRLVESPQIVSAITLLVNRSNEQGDVLAGIRNSARL